MNGTLNYYLVPKGSQINVRVKPQLKLDLEAVAEYHGLTVSSYVHSVLVREVRKEKENIPNLIIKSEQTLNAFVPEPESKRRVAAVVPHPAGKELVRKQFIGDAEIAEIESRVKPRKRKAR